MVFPRSGSITKASIFLESNTFVMLSLIPLHCGFVFLLNMQVNNFSIMSGQTYHFVGVSQYCRSSSSLMSSSRTQEDVYFQTRTSRFRVLHSTTVHTTTLYHCAHYYTLPLCTLLHSTTVHTTTLYHCAHYYTLPLCTLLHSTTVHTTLYHCAHLVKRVCAHPLSCTFTNYGM